MPASVLGSVDEAVKC